MHRKVLIAEQTETMRSVAETVLRQNGFEVISVSAASKAEEILKLARPDLIVVAADLEDNDHSLYFEKLKQDSRYNSIPRLLFEPHIKTDETFPDELIISRPFDPKDFLSKVASSLGDLSKPESSAVSNPLNSGSVDDDFLDAALGLDSLDVVDSEIMDQTQVGNKKKNRSPQEKMIGLAHEDNDDSFTDSSKIESLVIQDDASQIYHQQPPKKIAIPEGSGKLEILGDQFGLKEAQENKADDKQEAHDYNWFVDSMQIDSKPSLSPADSGKITFTDPSATVNPITPPPASVATSSTINKSPELATKEGVDKFIGEFKKEIEQLRLDDNEYLKLQEKDPSNSGSPKKLSWEEEIETIGHEQVAVFSKQFADSLGENVARIIVEKIDIEKLMQLIKNELLKNQQKPK